MRSAAGARRERRVVVAAAPADAAAAAIEREAGDHERRDLVERDRRRIRRAARAARTAPRRARRRDASWNASRRSPVDDPRDTRRAGRARGARASIAIGRRPRCPWPRTARPSLPTGSSDEQRVDRRRDLARSPLARSSAVSASRATSSVCRVAGLPRGDGRESSGQTRARARRIAAHHSQGPLADQGRKPSNRQGKQSARRRRVLAHDEVRERPAVRARLVDEPQRHARARGRCSTRTTSAVELQRLLARQVEIDLGRRARRRSSRARARTARCATRPRRARR